MQTCGEIWPCSRDSSSPTFLYVNKAATATVTLGLTHPGAAFPWYMHNKSERRRYKRNDDLWMKSCSTSPLSILPKPHFLSSCISSHGEVAGLNGQSSEKILALIDLSLYMGSHPPTCPLLCSPLPVWIRVRHQMWEWKLIIWNCHHSVWRGYDGCCPQWGTAAVYLDSFPTPIINPARTAPILHPLTPNPSFLGYTLTFHTGQKVITGKED